MAPPRMPRILITESEIQRLRDVVEQHAGGRDDVAAERLAAELDRAVVVERLPPGVAGMGSRVRFEHGLTGAIREVVLVYPTAASAAEGRVSVLAPIGAALLGLSVGDVIEWPLPDGRQTELRIVAVSDAEQDSATPAA